MMPDEHHAVTSRELQRVEAERDALRTRLAEVEAAGERLAVEIELSSIPVTYSAKYALDEWRTLHPKEKP